MERRAVDMNISCVFVSDWKYLPAKELPVFFFSSCFPRKKWLEGGFSRVVAPERKSF